MSLKDRQYFFLDANAPDCVKIKRVARSLGISHEKAFFLTVKLWCLARRRYPDGVLGDLLAAEVEEQVGWKGGAGRLVEAWRVAILLEVSEQGRYTVHQWAENSGYSKRLKELEKYRRYNEKRAQRKEPLPPVNQSQAGGEPRLEVRRDEVRRDEVRREEEKKKHCRVGNPTALVLQPDLPTQMPDTVSAVIAHYRTHHPRSRVGEAGSKEHRLVKARLSEGYTVGQLRDAIDGYHCSPFHQGLNDNGQKYLALELMVRDASHVDRGLQLLENPPTPMTPRELVKRKEAEEWERKTQELYRFIGEQE